MVNGSDKIATGAESIVDHDRYTLLMGQFCDFLQIRHVVPRIANTLEINSLRLVIDGGYELFGFIAIHEFAANAQPGEHDLELVVSATIQVGRRDDIVAGLSKSSDGHKLSGLAGRGGNCCHTTLKSSHALLKYIDSRLADFLSRHSAEVLRVLTYVHDTAVNVAKLFQAKEAGTMGGVVEDIALSSRVSRCPWPQLKFTKERPLPTVVA